MPLPNFRANMNELGDTRLYLRSIKNATGCYRRGILRGKGNNQEGRGHEVDSISAGSPCQGFSRANNNKNSTYDERKQSLIASHLTATDVYGPKYTPWIVL